MGMKRPRAPKANKEIMRVLNEVQQLLTPRSIEGYLTGGFVRDTLIGRDSGDVDIVVGAQAMELARDVAKALGGTFVPLDEVTAPGGRSRGGRGRGGESKESHFT
jgi:tRNA nucleotidyltransferase/poly(A) polymerase